LDSNVKFGSHVNLNKMNNEFLTPIEKAIDLVAQEEYKFNHSSIKEMSYRVGFNQGAQEVLNSPEKYGLFTKEQVIAMCDEQKKHDAEISLDEKHFFVGDIMNAILNAKNVAE